MRLVTLASLALGFASMQAPVGAADEPGYLARDMADLTALFAGRWDNDRHRFFAEAAGLDTKSLAPRQHLTITAIDGEENAFTALRTVEGEAPATLIHRFAIRDGAIVHTMTPQGAAASLDCVIKWSREAGQFEGEAEGEGCNALFPKPANEGDAEIELELSERDFWITVERGDEVTEARLRRARSFTCWAAIMRGAAHGDDTRGMRDWDFRQGVAIHDQGGEAVLVSDEETPRSIRLLLRDVDWTYGDRRPSLTLYVHEGDDDRAVSYAWTGGGEDRIGINLRWLQASCTADGTGD